MMVQIYACTGQWIIIRKSNMMDVFANMMNFCCISSPTKAGMATLLLGNVFCCIDLVCSTIEELYKSMCQLSLSGHQWLNTENNAVPTICVEYESVVPKSFIVCT